MSEEAREPTLRELIVDNRRLSSEVRKVADDIRTLENAEVERTPEAKPIMSGIRGELEESQQNLNSALVDLRRIYTQLKKKDTPSVR